MYDMIFLIILYHNFSTRWSDGSKIDYEKWAHNEPSNAFENERCAQLFGFSGMVLH